MGHCLRLWIQGPQTSCQIHPIRLETIVTLFAGQQDGGRSVSHDEFAIQSNHKMDKNNLASVPFPSWLSNVNGLYMCFSCTRVGNDAADCELQFSR